MEIKARETEEEFNSVLGRIGKIFYSKLGCGNARKYMIGLLGTSERKNGWQLSEYMGEGNPYKLQQFISKGSYSADDLRNEVRGMCQKT